MDAVIELPQIFRLVLALIFVLALMGGLAYLLKRLGLASGRSATGSARRLKAIEILPIDHRHKAVLLQRDDKQHLVILGPSGETVVERDIQPKETNDKA